jgi:hypothetical protein
LEETKMKRTRVAFSIVLLVLCSQSAFADFYHVSIDLPGLGGSGLQLQAALYDNSGVTGDSWVRMDNVVLDSAVDDFESSTLGGFDASLNPSSVNVAGGSLDGTGSFLMRIDEDLAVTPTIVFRDYLSPSGSTLTFDFEMTASATPGPLGLDEFVVSILDPATLDPLFFGLTGSGDVLAIGADGFQHSGEAGVTVVPTPAGLLLGLIGFGVGGLGLWRGRTHPV